MIEYLQIEYYRTTISHTTGMTDIKSLSEPEPSKQLILSEAAGNFLNSPYKEKFMTEFLIGSNKIKLYGNPIVMAERSELMKASLPKLSQPPYQFAEFGKILERPMTLLWLYMNGYGEFSAKNQLTLEEALHLFRLFGYFDVKTTDMFYALMVLFFLATSDEEAHKTLANERNKESLIRIVNYTFKTIMLEAAEIDKKIMLMAKGQFGSFLDDEKLQEIQQQTKVGKPIPGENIMMKIYNNFPEVAKRLDYIPVFINNKYRTYASRKVISDETSRHNISGNNSWTTSLRDVFTRIVYNGFWRQTLMVENWGPNDIRFRYELSHAVPQVAGGPPLLGPPPPLEEGLLSPII